MKNGKQQIREAAQNRKGKRLAAAVAVVAVAAGSALFIFGRDTQAPPPPMEEPAMKVVKNDGACHEIEAYECNLNEDGTQKRDGDGKCLEPNPDFSKYDCYWGDLVCDDNKDKVLDRDGNEVPPPPKYFVRLLLSSLILYLTSFHKYSTNIYQNFFLSTLKFSRLSHLPQNWHGFRVAAILAPLHHIRSYPKYQGAFL